MFDVTRDEDTEHCSSEITRTHSEEEFEYLEKSLIEHCEHLEFAVLEFRTVLLSRVVVVICTRRSRDAGFFTQSFVWTNLIIFFQIKSFARSTIIILVNS